MNKHTQMLNYVLIHFGRETTVFSKERGQWLLANIDQKIGWPQKKVIMIYRDRKVLLLPATNTFHAAAAVIIEDCTLNEGKIFLMNFLSALAWSRIGKIEVVEWTLTEGLLKNHVRMPLARKAGMTHLLFRPTYLPDPKDPKAQQALAFFREGLSLNHIGYSFLSFYKIINMKYPDGKKQKKWIQKNIAALDSLSHLKERMKELKKDYPDSATYIYNACRCAVAHASM